MSITSETRANALLAVPRKLLDDYLTQAAEQIARRRMVVGEQIRKAREAKHWKQKELAVRVHVEPQTISNWERGVRVPDWEKIEILARELDQPLTYFVSEESAAAIPDPEAVAGVEAGRELRVLVEALLRAEGIDPEQVLRDARLAPGEPERGARGRAAPGEAA